MSRPRSPVEPLGEDPALERNFAHTVKVLDTAPIVKALRKVPCDAMMRMVKTLDTDFWVAAHAGAAEAQLQMTATSLLNTEVAEVSLRILIALLVAPSTNPLVAELLRLKEGESPPLPSSRKAGVSSAFEDRLMDPVDRLAERVLASEESSEVTRT